MRSQAGAWEREVEGKPKTSNLKPRKPTHFLAPGNLFRPEKHLHF